MTKLPAETISRHLPDEGIVFWSMESHIPKFAVTTAILDQSVNDFRPWKSGNSLGSVFEIMLYSNFNGYIG